MSLAGFRTAAWAAMLCALCLGFSGYLCAQAPPGPLPPSHPLPPPPKAPPVKKKPEVESRSSLAGFWKLNQDESDDPKNKIQDSSRSSGGSGPGGGPGGGPRVGVGYPYPGGGPNGPYGGRSRGEEEDDRSQAIEEFVRPAFAQTIDLKQGEVDTTNEQDTKLVIYTDGRKLPKQKSNAPEAILAHWDGAKLVTDEKAPQGRKASRTFELSFDGKQIYETWRVEGRKTGSEIIIRYVYDAAIDEHR
jgi:hypothetical protein